MAMRRRRRSASIRAKLDHRLPLRAREGNLLQLHAARNAESAAHASVNCPELGICINAGILFWCGRCCPHAT